MRIRVISDIHLEFGSSSVMETFRSAVEKEDVVIIPGDLTTIKRRIDEFNCFELEYELSLLSELARLVVFVPGNHEYYGGDLKRDAPKLKSLFDSIDNVAFLNEGEEVITLDDVNIIGGTLWTNYDENPMCELVSSQTLNDFVVIKYGGKIMAPGFIKTTFYKTLKNIQEFLKTKKGEKNIVVTHHAPFFLSCPDRFKKDIISLGYNNQIEKYIPEDEFPLLWIHGHNHNSCDYEVAPGSRVICNPYGYWLYEENKDFDINLTLEV